MAFGRFAEENSKRKGTGIPGTFDFLGFTHYCGKSKQGKFRIKRKTSKKKFRAKIKMFKMWIKAERNRLNTWEIFEKAKEKLRGHYQYYGITDNLPMLESYYFQVERLLFKWLNRRSQRKSFDIHKFRLYLEYNPLPRPKINVNIYG